MLARLLLAILPSIVSLTFGLQLAHADIYTWVDATGRVNVSNLTPPAGARVTSIMRESAPKVAPPADSYREAARQAEVLALADRVRQLEYEAELARRLAAPPVEYSAAPAAPQVQYVFAAAPPPVQYVADVAPPASTLCNPAWTYCGPFGVSSLYPSTVFVVRAPNFRRFHPGGHGTRHVAPQRTPMRTAGGLRPLNLR